MTRSYETLALFDLDGTLLRAGDPVHVSAFEHALRTVFGVPATIAGRRLGGRADRDIAREALAEHGISTAAADARHREVAAIMGRYYALRVGDGDRDDWLLPGVGELLRRLGAAGIAVGLVTGGVEPIARRKLAAAGLDRLVRTGAYGDQHAERHRLVELAIAACRHAHERRFLAADAVVIGDTPADIEAARAIGCRSVAVATGRYSPDDLAAAGPDAVFNDLSRTEVVVSAILGRGGHNRAAR